MGDPRVPLGHAILLFGPGLGLSDPICKVGSLHYITEAGTALLQPLCHFWCRVPSPRGHSSLFIVGLAVQTRGARKRPSLTGSQEGWRWEPGPH